MWQLSTDLLAVSDAEGRVLAANPAWETLLGWTPSEVAGDRAWALLHPDDLARTRLGLGDAVSDKEHYNFEARMRSRDGSYRAFSWRTSPADGRIFSIGRDITERLEREEAARHAQKLEAIGQLTGGIAHDFNNLLTIIRSSLDFLKKPDLTPARRTRYVAAIDDAVERAAKVTLQLLAFARRQRLDPQVFDVGERIADVSELLRQVVGPKIRIETAAPAGACHVEADLSQFETALMNLVINARDAMSGQGRLAIEAKIVDRLPAVRHHAPAGGEFVSVTVRDTGTGIAPELQARIFEPFFTTKEPGKGTGLGLSQAYGFAKQSGGTIGVQSEPGGGAAFSIYLPRSEPAAEAETSGPAEAQPLLTAASGDRALVVEDNEEVGRFCVSLMRDLGYRPTWARNGNDALRRLNQDPGGYDLVFSDVVMPGMSGVELAEAIRQGWPALPILLTSGYSAVLAEKGSRGFPLLAKPYSAHDLRQALTHLSSAEHARHTV
jgi:PAS domain S-box-containing protein